jgi:hypothetical protein
MGGQSFGRMTATRRRAAKKSYAIAGLFLLFLVMMTLLASW